MMSPPIAADQRRRDHSVGLRGAARSMIRTTSARGTRSRSDALASERRLPETVFLPGSLTVVFQPIVWLHNGRRGLHGFEALVRGPRHPGLFLPDVLFERARRAGEEPRLDRTALAAIVSTITALPLDAPVSINVHASTLEDVTFVRYLVETASRHSVRLSRLVVEIVEHVLPKDHGAFQRTLCGLRAAGIRVAIDDVGLGYSNHRMILDTRPDYLKVDRYLVSGCHRSPERRVVLESLAGLAARLGARVVAEGVERPDELATLISLGIDLVQGFLLSPPLAPAALRAGREAAVDRPSAASAGFPEATAIA